MMRVVCAMGGALLLVHIAAAQVATPPWRCADVSYLEAVEEGGGRFVGADGLPDDALRLMQAAGINMVRLRVWHTPANERNDRAATLRMARRAKASGMDVLLALHYSDTWADPGQQALPQAWQGLSASVLADSVEVYTRSLLDALVAQDTPPAVVQLGNEITSGMLWDAGRVGGTFDTAAQWRTLASLLATGERAVAATVPDARTMIHIDRGGDLGTSRWFFDNLMTQGITPDIIGLSFYPWWHGSLGDLQQTLDGLTAAYNADVMVVETAYPWTLDWFDNTHNLVGLASQLHAGYPASPEGQRRFVEAVMQRVADVSGGLGVCYWAPDAISTSGFGSPVENMAWFDDAGRMLPVLEAFSTPTTTEAIDLPEPITWTAYPNPATNKVDVVLTLNSPNHVGVTVFDALGRAMLMKPSRWLGVGTHTMQLDVSALPAGMYGVRINVAYRMQMLVVQ